MKLNFFKLLQLLIISAVFLCSCSPQYKLVKQFYNRNDTVSILVLPPKYINKSNLIIKSLYTDFNNLPIALQDTIWERNTVIINNVVDSVIIEQYYSNFISNLQLSGMIVYDYKNIDEFFKLPHKSLIIQIAQFQLEEDRQNIDFNEELDVNYEVFKNIDINIVSLNVWFELYDAQNDTLLPTVLYAEKKISDEIDGRFFSITQENKTDSIVFKYKRKDIKFNDTYMLAREAGTFNAQEITDYFFNQYVNSVFPTSKLYYGYKLKEKTLYYPEQNQQVIKIEIK